MVTSSGPGTDSDTVDTPGSIGPPVVEHLRGGTESAERERKWAAVDQSVAACFQARWRALEERVLYAGATRSYPADRKVEEADCTLRTPFQRDRDRIVHSKAFRRLKHKTQVFVSPKGDHYRTRLTHTLEVTMISRTVARALRLNEDLVEAIGLGHDLGHTPFGHIGEEALDRCLMERFGRRFRHYEHSLRVVEVLEGGGVGLNLTAAVRDGILGHSTGAKVPATMEARIVRLLDRVAYINHDIDDSIRAGLLTEGDLPGEAVAMLGSTGSQRIDALVHDIVEASERAGDVAQSPEVGAAMDTLRSFMFERIYLGPEVRAEKERITAVIERLFDHYVTDPVELPDSVGGEPQQDIARRVTDYIAGMTDRYCVERYTRLQVPRAFAR